MTQRNPLLESVSGWFNRTFADPGAVSLFMTIVFTVVVIEFFGRLLLPVLISVIIAYLLYSVVRLLERWRCPHFLSVLIVYLLFLGVLVYAIFGLVPMLWKQLSNLVAELPNAFSQSQTWLSDLGHKYPKVFAGIQVHHVVALFKDQTAKVGQVVLQYSLQTIPSIIQVVLYLVLVPLFVFFMLKDKASILHWFETYMPSNRGLVQQVWDEVNHKIGCYVRGRVIEVIIIGVISYVAFALLGLQYAGLLGALVGLSVIIPYVGAVVVTIPIVILGLMQWGFAAHFWYLIIVYAIIITLDANVLVPILFSETMSLHPIVIILAVVFFGGVWGFWGVFFAIPLATLINAILKAWPRRQKPAVE